MQGLNLPNGGDLSKHEHIVECERKTEFTVGLQPFDRHDSSNRLQMFYSQFGQVMTLRNPDKRRIMTMVEREYGKYTFSVKIPEEADIVDVIDYIPKDLTSTATINPRTAVIYETTNKRTRQREYGYIEIPYVFKLHKDFGFICAREGGRITNLPIKPGTRLDPDSVLADTPAIDSDLDYRFGLELMTAFMSIPGVVEDGYIISESAAKRLGYHEFKTVSGSAGEKYYFLNIYGDENNFKPFPEPGEKVGDHGIVFALRRFDRFTAAMDLNPTAMCEPDTSHDLCYRAKPGSTVYDVRVIHNQKPKGTYLPTGTTELLTKYADYYRRFSKAVYNSYASKLARNPNASFQPPYVIEAAKGYAGRGATDGRRDPMHGKKRILRSTVLDEWYIEIDTYSEMYPRKGSKASDLHGGKGVCCGIWPDYRMPRNKFGEVADIIVDPDSTIKRMNIGKVYEHFFNSFYAQLRIKALRDIKIDPSARKTYMSHLLGSYYYACPKQFAMLMDPEYQKRGGDLDTHFDDFLMNGHYLYFPTDNPVDYEYLPRLFQRKFGFETSPLTYVNDNLKEVTTKDEMILGTLYYILLEKTATDFMAIASCKTQHHGTPQRMNEQDKMTSPHRPQPTRFNGETETRYIRAYAGELAMIEHIDRSNSLESHREECRSIAIAPDPFRIAVSIDRNKVPLGRSRSANYLKHIFQCQGIEFAIDDNVLGGNGQWWAENQKNLTIKQIPRRTRQPLEWT